MSFSQKERRRVQLDFSDSESLTEQCHKDSCDINNILGRAQRTGILEHVAASKGYYGTAPTGDDFQRHQNIVAKAQSMFESLPSSIRNKFENNPAKYLDFMTQDKNYEAIKELGLDASHLKPPAPVAPNETLSSEQPPKADV